MSGVNSISPVRPSGHDTVRGGADLDALTSIERFAAQPTTADLLGARPPTQAWSASQWAASAKGGAPLLARGGDDAAQAELEALTPEQRELLLDLTQLGLGIAGIVDPSGVADATDAVISFGRGDWLGGIISGVSIVPVLGDLAKAGKLGTWAETVVKAVDLAGSNARFAKQLQPVVRRIDQVLDRIPLDRLPAAVREPLERIRGQIDRFFAGAGLEQGLGWRGRGEPPKPWNTSTANGTSSDCNWCSLEIVTGMDRDALRSAVPGVGPGERMSAAELRAAVRKLGLGGEISPITGRMDDVLRRMETLPVGQYFTVNITYAGGGGHVVVARNTSEGVQVLDGQINQDYLARHIDPASAPGRGAWEAVPLNGVRNENL